MRLHLLCVFLACAIDVTNAQTAAAQARQAPDPRSLVLVGDRFKPLKYDEMTPQQKTMIDHLLAGERRGANGPFNVLLRSPEVGDLAQQFGGATRFRASLPRDVSETIIIMTGRFWMAQYEWTAHKAAALQNGVKPGVVDAIATGKRPTGMAPEMARLIEAAKAPEGARYGCLARCRIGSGTRSRATRFRRYFSLRTFIFNAGGSVAANEMTSGSRNGYRPSTPCAAWPGRAAGTEAAGKPAAPSDAGRGIRHADSRNTVPVLDNHEHQRKSDRAGWRSLQAAPL